MAYMEQHHIIKQKEKIILGLSGGADSVCLFHVLNVCREKYGIELFAVHVNHGIRGMQAKEDQEFVEKLCASYQVPLTVITEDVPQIAKKEKKSLEEAGRMVRYQAFRKLQKEIGADYIAVAHHKNDQAETVLHNLCRGSGVAGLVGMQTEREGIIRPLLCVEREEIEEYLKTKGQPYQIDSTNLDNVYMRNKWRNQIIPLMSKEVNAQTVSHIADTASIMGEVADFIEKCGMRAWNTMIETKEETIVLDLEKWSQEHIVIQKWILQNMLYQLSGEQKDIGQVHVLNMMELSKKQVGKILSLPYHLQARRVYQGILLEKIDDKKEKLSVSESKKNDIQKNKGQDNKEKNSRECNIATEESVWEINISPKHISEKKVIRFSAYQIEQLESGMEKFVGEKVQNKDCPESVLRNQRVVSIKKRIIEKCRENTDMLEKKTRKNNCTKWFDYDKIKGTVLFRRKEQEDFLQIDGIGHHKKIKKLLKDEKVDATEREKLWLFAEGKHVIWIPGIRISEAYKVDKDTKTILEISIREEEREEEF